ncbi:hypothetical protein D9611_000610 [Ephemerocybe angulata]|uniref:Uncharacterized protein n=1 Tax=Ephemerocybe angulata TaxID=980116 RepID=A0A8H5BMV7_9AGAR|nr:hypothetical protein D9611_000610 [Tulosesus angulatus]
MVFDSSIKLNSNGHRNNASQLRGTGYAGPADTTLPPYCDPQGGLLAPPPQQIQNRDSHNLGSTFNNEHCAAPILNGATQVQHVGNSQTTNNGATANAYGGICFTSNNQYHDNAKHYNPVGDGMTMIINENLSPSRMESKAPQAEALGQGAQQPQVSQQMEQSQDLRTQDNNQRTQNSNQRARERDQMVQENRQRAQEPQPRVPSRGKIGGMAKRLEQWVEKLNGVEKRIAPEVSTTSA